MYVMKLNDYFKKQKKISLSMEEKFLLYDKIQSQKFKQSNSINRIKIISYLKYWVLSFFGIFLLVFAYYSLLWDYNSQRWLISFWKWIDDYKFSHASAIGKIIKATWQFKIVKDWQVFITDTFSDWDIIDISSWSLLVFDINDTLQASILWPAKITVHKLANQRHSYRIHLLQWDFINIKSKSNISNQIVEVATNDWTVIQDVSSWKEKIDFAVIKKDQKAFVYNKSSSKIKITKKVMTTVHNKSKTISYDNSEVSLVDVSKSEKNSNTWHQEIENIINQVEKLVSWWIVNQNITWDSDISSVSVVDKQKIEQLKRQISLARNLDQIMYKKFIEANVFELMKYYLLGDKNKYQIALYNLSLKLNSIYKLFWIKKNKTYKDLNSIYSVIWDLLNLISQNYSFLTKETGFANLVTTKNWIFYLKNNYSFGKYWSWFWANWWNLEQLSKFLWLKLENYLLFR